MLLPGLCFFLGIANIALHRAVMESGHAMLEQMQGFAQALGGRLPLAMESAVLLAALLGTANGYPVWGWLYIGYSALNGFTAWLMLTGRV